MYVERRNSRISDTRIFSPLLARHSKYGALIGYGFCVGTRISDGLARQGLLVTGSKKVPTLIDKVYCFRIAIRHECPVQRSLNSYSYGWFGSLVLIQLRLSKMTSY